MKPRYLFAVLLFLAACNGAETPANDSPESTDTAKQTSEKTGIDTTVVDSIPGPPDLPMPERPLKFTPPKVVMITPPEEDMIMKVGPEMGATGVKPDWDMEEGRVIDNPPIDYDMPLIYAEEMPQFIGDLAKYLDENVKYPESAKESKIEGKVIVRFIVTREGSVKDPEIIKALKGNDDVNVEALRVIKSTAGLWKPGKQNRKPVDVYYTLPVKFELPE